MKVFNVDLTSNEMSDMKLSHLKPIFNIDKNLYSELRECECQFYEYPSEAILDNAYYIGPSFDYDR